MKSIFLDSHSTTPVDPRVWKVIKPYFSKYYYNPASLHFGGEKITHDIENARCQVASIIKAKPDDVYFTNSATEANNIVLKGIVKHFSNKDNRVPIVITSNVEHSSIIETLKAIHKDKVVSHIELKVNRLGIIDYKELEKILDKLKNLPILVSIIAANNEIGTIANIDLIGQICKRYNALFHTDVTQAIGRVDIDVEKHNIFALTCSGHKIYSIKGCGVLYIKDHKKVEPIIDGGYQNILSSGTINVPAVIGIGKACEILRMEGKAENERLGKLRDLLWEYLYHSIPRVFVNGDINNRLPHNLNITIPGVKSEVFIKGLNDIMISGGSACQSGNIEPSHVIKAIGAPYPECAIRFGISRYTTKRQIKYVSKRIMKIYENVY